MRPSAPAGRHESARLAGSRTAGGSGRTCSLPRAPAPTPRRPARSSRRLPPALRSRTAWPRPPGPPARFRRSGCRRARAGTAGRHRAVRRSRRTGGGSTRRAPRPARPRKRRRAPSRAGLAPPRALDVERVLDRLRLGAAELSERHQHDPRVEAERPVVDVPGIEAKALLPRDLVAAHDLRPAGDAGLDLEAAPVPGLVVRDLLDEV